MAIWDVVGSRAKSIHVRTCCTILCANFAGKRNQMATCASDSCSASVPLQSIIPRRASVETLSGYTCSFVREPDASFSCPVCARVLRQPQLTDCCGNHFCTSCLSRWLETSSSCPLCRQVGFRSIKDKKMERALHDLEVRT